MSSLVYEPYLDDGQIEMDNSAAERALRAVALGRKNHLVAGSDAGGERAAAIYSLLGTVKLNGLDPELYLRRVPELIADHPINRIQELLPLNLAAEVSAQADLSEREFSGLDNKSGHSKREWPVC
jgi:hypothetical protein